MFLRIKICVFTIKHSYKVSIWSDFIWKKISKKSLFLNIKITLCNNIQWPFRSNFMLLKICLLLRFSCIQSFDEIWFLIKKISDKKSYITVTLYDLWGHTKKDRNLCIHNVSIHINFHQNRFIKRARKNFAKTEFFALLIINYYKV